MRRLGRLFDFQALRRPEAVALLVLFFVVDVILIVLHVGPRAIGATVGTYTDLGVDRAYGEFIMYIKLGWTSLLCLWLARVRHSALFAILGAICAILVVEDALTVHERVGFYLSETVATVIPALSDVGILSLQVGELLWLGALSVLLLVAFVMVFRRSPGPVRRDALSLSVFLLAMAFFAVVVDTIHSLFPLGSTMDLIFTTVEEGGELMALTPLVALAFALVMRAAHAERSPGSTSALAQDRG